jgi:hypothetical protein
LKNAFTILFKKFLKIPFRKKIMAQFKFYKSINVAALTLDSEI